MEPILTQQKSKLLFEPQQVVEYVSVGVVVLGVVVVVVVVAVLVSLNHFWINCRGHALK